MYKIYINRNLLLLSPEPVQQSAERQLTARYSGRVKSLLNYVDMMEKSHRYEVVNLYFQDTEVLFRDFCSHFRIAEAAGGIVRNPRGELLVIFRLGFWDLPKGHIDPGEQPEAAAVREVQEETGVQELTPDGFALTSWHAFRDKNQRRTLKPTHWYYMHTNQEILHPQAEENIEKATWISPADFLEQSLITYPGILEIIRLENSRTKI